MQQKKSTQLYTKYNQDYEKISRHHKVQECGQSGLDEAVKAAPGRILESPKIHGDSILSNLEITGERRSVAREGLIMKRQETIQTQRWMGKEPGHMQRRIP